MGSARAHYECIKAFSETDFTEDSPHGLCSTHPEIVNPDFLAFVRKDQTAN